MLNIVSINFIFVARTYQSVSTKMLSVRPVSGLFTSAWIAEAIALGEHFICCIEGFGYKKTGGLQVALFY
ncbi:hypothetical protein EMIT0P258_120032 [Pseudomonas sp. IT-P258]